VSAWAWIIVVAAVAVLVAVTAWLFMGKRRTQHLRERFGPEYDRVARSAPSRRDAEAELEARETKRDQLNVRPLEEASRARYAEAWADVQKQFVDDPEGAVDKADDLLRQVLTERGYPDEDDFERRAADISVDHPRVVESYREGRRLALASRTGEGTTEDLRSAMQHYRELFTELVDAREPSNA